MTHPLHNFLQRMNDHEDGGDSGPVFPMKEAQADMLRQVVELSQMERPRFKRGQAVHYMAGTGPLTKVARDGMVFIFWDYVDRSTDAGSARLETMGQAHHATLPDPDCVIAWYTGNDLRFDVSCSYLLLPGDA